MATPSLASIVSNSNIPPQTILGKATSSPESRKSEMNDPADDLKRQSAPDALKRDKSNLQRSQKPLQKNPFTTHRDPVTGRWIVERNKR